MAGAGNICQHDYEEVDADEVWVAVQDHLPPLRTVVEHELGFTRRRRVNKQHILDEIKQTAEANGGAQDTGIKVTDQYSRYRAQWGDALQ